MGIAPQIAPEVNAFRVKGEVGANGPKIHGIRIGDGTGRQAAGIQEVESAEYRYDGVPPTRGSPGASGWVVR